MCGKAASKRLNLWSKSSVDEKMRESVDWLKIAVVNMQKIFRSQNIALHRHLHPPPTTIIIIINSKSTKKHTVTVLFF